MLVSHGLSPGVEGDQPCPIPHYELFIMQTPRMRFFGLQHGFWSKTVEILVGYCQLPVADSVGTKLASLVHDQGLQQHCHRIIFIIQQNYQHDDHDHRHPPSSSSSMMNPPIIHHSSFIMYHSSISSTITPRSSVIHHCG